MTKLLALSLLLGPTFLVASASCGQHSSPSEGGPRYAPSQLPYRILAPDTVIHLPKKLDEISGLTSFGNGQIGAVNDEDGDLFLLDSRTGSLLNRIKFAGDGDYEGVEAVGDAAFVLRSDGRLYELRSWQSDDIEVEKHDTGLRRKCDAEGLGLDPTDGSLLIVCKEYAGKNLKGKRAVYRYAIDTGTLVNTPVLVIDALNDALTPPEGGVSKAFRKFFKIPRFKPSGIALHPVSGDAYVVSSRSNGLAVFGRDGELLHSTFLDPTVFRQPEGIAFDSEATLYISSEGRSGPGVLARFRYQPSTGEPVDNESR